MKRTERTDFFHVITGEQQYIIMRNLYFLFIGWSDWLCGTHSRASDSFCSVKFRTFYGSSNWYL